MNGAQLIALAQAAAQIFAIVRENVATAKTTLQTDELGALKGILDPLHAENMATSAELDALLAEAEKR